MKKPAKVGGDRAAVTLHQRIVGDIQEKIVSGQWPVGHRIPFEIDLARDYGVSRMTVNKALTQLARTGLIERIRKGGSFVSQPLTQSAVLEIGDIRSEVETLKLPYAFHLLAVRQRKAKRADLERIDVEVGDPLLAVTCTHLAGPRPFCLEDRLISLTTVPDAATVDFGTVAPSQWLLSQVPWTTAEHRIHAAAANDEAALALKIHPGTPCLVVERRTWSGSGPVTHVTLTYPGDRHALVARFTPARG